MGDINVHYTQVAKSSNAAATTGANLKGSGVFSSAGGMAFWDLILTQIGQTAETTKPTTPTAAETAAGVTTPETGVAVDVETSLLGEDADLAMAIDESLLALLGEEVAPSDEEKPMSLFDILHMMQNKKEGLPLDQSLTSTEQVKKQIALYQKLIDKLTAGMPLESKDSNALEAMIGRLMQQTELLRTGKIDGEEAPLQLFIAMGLTPAQLTQVGEKIARLEEKLGRDITIEDIIAGIGNVLEPIKSDASKTSLGFARESVPTPALPASAGTVTPEERARYQRAGDQPGPSPLQAKSDNAPVNNAPAKIAAPHPSFSTVLTAQNTSGSVNAPQTWQAIFADNITPSGFDIHTGLPMTQAAQAAHATVAITQAGQSHPATQLVHTTLNKMAKDGPTEMTIQMDPPELGRVLAKLQFGKDKTVKAVLTIEKPETYTMLIRDAAALERALQNAGLNTDSASLSFELAQDGSAFNSNNDGKGGGEPSGRNALSGVNDNDDIIQTSMTWQVDSETGYVRYNLLA